MVLVALMISTSLALAVTVTAWLVPPYLVLMVWILGPVRDPRDPAQASAEPGSEPVSDGEYVPELDESGIEFRSQAESVAGLFSSAEPETEQDLADNPDPVAVKTRRKGRGRKAKGGTIVEPAVGAATWIQVGPGKFVRVEGPGSNAPAEPPPAPAVSEGEPSDSRESALPAFEDAGEPLLREFAPEVGPEPEDRLATLEAPVHPEDDFDQVEPITENALASRDAEVPLRTSLREVVSPIDRSSPFREYSFEASPEPEGRLATFVEPADFEEQLSDEPIADGVFSSPDVEASLRPSPEEVVLPGLEDSTVEEVAEPVSRELVSEIRFAPGDRPAILEVQVARNELARDEPIAVDVLPPPGAEASLRPSLREEVASPELDGSRDDEPHHDDDATSVDDGARADASAFDEAVAKVEEEGDGPALVTGESHRAPLGLEDSEVGPVEPSGDQGIALDAPAVAWITEPMDLLLLEEASRAARSPSHRSISSPSRSTAVAPYVSWRGVWPRIGLATSRNSGKRPSGRVVRSGSKSRFVPSVPRRYRRGVGAYRQVCRTFPPRSPPVCG